MEKDAVTIAAKPSTTTRHCVNIASICRQQSRLKEHVQILAEILQENVQ